MIKVLVVDDSPAASYFLTGILNSEPSINVIGTAANGEQAIEMAGRIKPDIIVMDIYMPKVDGFEATRKIMETVPTPIIVVTANLTNSEVSNSFRAIEAGALAAVQKPEGVGSPRHKETVDEFVKLVRLMSDVKVVKRWASTHKKIYINAEKTKDISGTVRKNIKLIAIGASTGGPPVLQKILSGLSPEIPVPILIVQHISPGFTKGLIDWLSQYSVLPVVSPVNGEKCRQGHVYVAIDGYHMGIDKDLNIKIVQDGTENGHKPSISFLFHSVAENLGKDAAGILLTGMGRDGADGLKTMKGKGALTIVQDRESCTVYGMPGEAANIYAADYILSPDKIITAINNMFLKTDSKSGSLMNGSEINNQKIPENHVLVVEDSPTQAQQLQFTLEQRGYRTSCASNGLEALDMIKTVKPSIIISDIIMPEMNGYQLCQAVKSDCGLKNIPIILLTSLVDPTDVIKGLECGADNFIMKPVDTQSLINSIRHLLSYKEQNGGNADVKELEITFRGQTYSINTDRLQILNLLLSTFDMAIQNNYELINIQNELRELNTNLEKKVEERTKSLSKEIGERMKYAKELKESYIKLKGAMKGTIEVVTKIIEKRDPYTAGHQKRVASLAVAIAKEMKLDGHIIEGIHIAGVIHDIGKIQIPAEILSKPSQLSGIEMMLVKNHTLEGYEIIKTINFPWHLEDIIFQHHERLDGSGYPSGLKGDEINVGARIIGVADVVEAMASHRPYRPSLGVEKALEEIKKNSGILYDEKIVKICLDLFNVKGFKF